MVVLQLGPYPPPHGGVQTNIVAIREHLRRHGIGAPVINLTRHRAEEADEVFYPRSASQVIKLLWSLRSDIIHVHIGGQLTRRLLALCLVCTLIPGKRVVLTFHSGGYPSWQRGEGAQRFSFRNFVLRRLDAIIAVNTEIAELFRSLGVSPSRISVRCPYTPVAVSDDDQLPEPLRTFREAHRPLLTTVGLLEPEYDLALQVKALAAIRHEYPDAGLVIIGSGSLERELRQLISDDPSGGHILLCGDVPHPATVKVISRSDAFLRTTLYDGDSISVREALQLGVPVIASDNGMRPAGVHLIPPANLEALSAAVRSVLHAPTGRTAPPAAPGSSDLDDLLALYRGLLPAGRRLAGESARTIS
jgi:glycogen(starch) synthase